MVSAPRPSEVLKEVLKGSTQENLTAAAAALKRCRSEDVFVSSAHEELTLALQGYNQALEKADLVGQGRATAMLQLGKVHVLRAIAEYSPYPKKRRFSDPQHVLVRYHTGEGAKCLQSYRKELGDPVAASEKLLGVATNLIKVCDINVDVPRLRYSLSSMLSSHLLGGETSGYEGSRLPRVQLEMYIANQCFLQAVRALSGDTSNVSPVFVELKQACMCRDEDEDSLLGKWMAVQQQMMQGKTHLQKALHHFERGSGDEADSEAGKALKGQIQDLADRMKFLLQRALVISRLASAVEKQRQTLQEHADFDMSACYEVIDMFREAEDVADKLEKAGVDTSGFENCPRGADVEMLCIASHFHAKLLTAMGLRAQSRKKHVFLLCTALSLDMTPCAGWDVPTELLRQKPWFMESKRVVEEAQKEDREAEEKQRQEDLKEIEPEIKALQAARQACNTSEGQIDVRPLVKHLLEKHPPSKAVDQSIKDALSSSELMTRKAFLKTMALYHPDKQGADLAKSKKLLFEEIMKVMNTVYELSFK